MKPPPIRDQSESSQISQSQGFFSKLLEAEGGCRGVAPAKLPREVHATAHLVLERRVCVMGKVERSVR
jgi:hypothetical protein